jgi:hypothetical protein
LTDRFLKLSEKGYQTGGSRPTTEKVLVAGCGAW